jgi:hypothetical protein
MMQTTSRITLIVALALVASASGCGRTKPVEPAPAPPAAPVTPTDSSLSVADYKAAGVPAPDKKWSREELKKAATALAALAAKDPGSLPRFRSERSGEIFARLADVDLLTPLKDRSVPIAKRMPAILEIIEPGNQIFMLYIAARQRNAVADGEVVEMSGYMLRVVVVGVQLNDEFAPTLDRNDATFMTRLGGLERSKRGMATMLIGTLQIFRDTNSVGPEQRKRLLEYIRETFPPIIVALNPDQRKQILGLVDEAAAAPDQAELQPDLTKLSVQLKELAAKADSAPPKQPVATAEDLKKHGMVMHRSQAGEPGKDGWCIAKSTGAGFSVELPGRFNDFSHANKAVDGVTMKLDAVGTTILPEMKFSAMAVKRSDGTFMPAKLEDFGKSFEKDGNKVTKRAIEVHGHAGIEVHVKGKKSSAFFRLFRANGSTYQMIVEYPPIVSEESATANAQRFFNSFTFAKAEKE